MPAQYINSRGKEQRRYFMDRDGFSLVAMSLTGKEALDWKVKYIGAFNQMERLLIERQTSEWKALRTQSKAARRIEKDSVQAFIEYAKAQGSKNASRYYANLTKLVNKAAGNPESGNRYAAKFSDVPGMNDREYKNPQLSTW